MLLLQKCDFKVVYKLKQQHVMIAHLSSMTTTKAPTSVVDNFLDENLFMVQVNLEKN